MAAAYGLYTHIQSNRRRSILLLIGLFFLVYVMVFAGALAAEAMSYDASLQWLLQRAWIDAVKAAPFATVGTALWMFIAYKFNQSLGDLVTRGREVTRQERPLLRRQRPRQGRRRPRHRDRDRADRACLVSLRGDPLCPVAPARISR